MARSNRYKLPLTRLAKKAVDNAVPPLSPISKRIQGIKDRATQIAAFKELQSVCAAMLANPSTMKSNPLL